MIFDETSPRTSSGLTITICIKITVNLSNVMFTYKGSLHDSQIIRQPNVIIVFSFVQNVSNAHYVLI